MKPGGFYGRRDPNSYLAADERLYFDAESDWDPKRHRGADCGLESFVRKHNVIYLYSVGKGQAEYQGGYFLWREKKVY